MIQIYNGEPRIFSNVPSDAHGVSITITNRHPARADFPESSVPSRLRKKTPNCHREEAKPSKDVGICLKIQIPGSFAALRMTTLERFSAACQHPARATYRFCPSTVYCPPPRPCNLALLRDFTLIRPSANLSRKLSAIAYVIFREIPPVGKNLLRRVSSCPKSFLRSLISLLIDVPVSLRIKYLAPAIQSDINVCAFGCNGGLRPGLSKLVISRCF